MVRPQQIIYMARGRVPLVTDTARWVRIGAGGGLGGYGQGPPSARASGFFGVFIDLK